MNELPQRLEKQIQRVPESGCWIWMGALSRNGYGNVHARPYNIVAHKHVFQTLVGPVPAGLDLDHVCRVRCCVNPAHLEPVSRFENLRRGGVIARLMTRAAGLRGKPRPARAA